MPWSGRVGSMSIYLGLGTNLGDRERNLQDAIEHLKKEMKVTCVSSPYDTEPVGHTDQPRFLNAVVEVETDLDPEALLRLVKNIEDDMGRAANFRYGPRLIDLDILLYDDMVMDTPSLTIPHPRYAQRAFVLAPLAEIAAEVVCPVRRRSVAELLVELEDTSGVVKREWTRR